jgi:hypothetical protein
MEYIVGALGLLVIMLFFIAHECMQRIAYLENFVEKMQEDVQKLVAVDEEEEPKDLLLG